MQGGVAEWEFEGDKDDERSPRDDPRALSLGVSSNKNGRQVLTKVRLRLILYIMLPSIHHWSTSLISLSISLSPCVSLSVCASVSLFYCSSTEWCLPLLLLIDACRLILTAFIIKSLSLLTSNLTFCIHVRRLVPHLPLLLKPHLTPLPCHALPRLAWLFFQSISYLITSHLFSSLQILSGFTAPFDKNGVLFHIGASRFLIWSVMTHLTLTTLPLYTVLHCYLSSSVLCFNLLTQLTACFQ